MQWYLEAFRRYAEFSGRSRRRAYWFFVLFNLIVSFVLAGVDAALMGPDSGLLLPLYGLAALIPGIAVSVRRLHDIGRSGWWLLIGLIPLVGAIVLLVFYVQDSQPGDNAYGPNPKVAMA